ncbi:MAG: uncharacterized membrane protein YqaE (UPF0057 family) [Saprospiraceae bacterium]|jgi:uncharacterized membrane protein YqaE (UPF0057 family)
MKKLTLLTFSLLFFLQSQAVVSVSPNWASQFQDQSEVKNLSSEMSGMDLTEFLNLTPKKYREKTGKRLGLKKSLQLRAAQKVIKKKMKNPAGGDISSGLYVLLAILGLGWLAMGILSDWDGQDWIINLVLTVLCWLPGLIHALVKKKDYF